VLLAAVVALAPAVFVAAAIGCCGWALLKPVAACV